MRKLAFIAAFMAVATVFVFGGSTAKAEETQQENKPKKTEKVMVTVQQGDTLSKIASAHDTTYVRIFNANEKIADPDVIHPGDKYRIPRPDEVLPKRELPKAVPAPVTSQPVTTPKPAPAPAGGSNFASGDSVWDLLAACESGGNWAINTGNGYYGGLQFSLSSWRGVGGSGYPHQASREEQIARGEKLRASGGWGHWPACSAKLGLL